MQTQHPLQETLLRRENELNLLNNTQPFIFSPTVETVGYNKIMGHKPFEQIEPIKHFEHPPTLKPFNPTTLKPSSPPQSPAILFLQNIRAWRRRL